MTNDVVSIEKVLNSRCSSDFDLGTKKRNWGTLIDQRPPKKIIDRILRCCNIPRFSNKILTHWFKNGYLFLGFKKPSDPYGTGASY